MSYLERVQVVVLVVVVVVVVGRGVAGLALDVEECAPRRAPRVLRAPVQRGVLRRGGRARARPRPPRAAHGRRQRHRHLAHTRLAVRCRRERYIQ